MPLSDTTDAKGIYALVGVPSGTSCTINVTKTGYEFSGRTVTVGTSEDKEASCGNKWGINFTGTRPGGSTTGTVKVLWDLHHGILEGWEPETGYSDLMAQLEEEGYHVSTTSSGIEAVNLYSYDVLVISVGTSWDSTYGVSEVELIRDFVERGGGLLVLGDHPRCPNYIRPVAMDYGFITAIDESYEGDVYITNFTDHPIFRGCSSLYFRVAGSIAYSPGATLVAWDFRRYGVVGVGSPGQGRVVVTGDCDFCRQYYIDERSNKRFAQNLFDWLSKKMP